MTPTTTRLRQVVDELSRRSAPSADPGLAALEVAILLEDALGVVLDDDGIDRLAREGTSAVEDVVGRRGGGP